MSSYPNKNFSASWVACKCPTGQPCVNEGCVYRHVCTKPNLMTGIFYKILIYEYTDIFGNVTSIQMDRRLYFDLYRVLPEIVHHFGKILCSVWDTRSVCICTCDILGGSMYIGLFHLLSSVFVAGHSLKYVYFSPFRNYLPFTSLYNIVRTVYWNFKSMCINRPYYLWIYYKMEKGVSISFLLLCCNKVPQIQCLKTPPIFFSPGLWARAQHSFSWVLCSGFHKAEIKGGVCWLCLHLEGQLEENMFQAHLGCW